MSECKGTLPDGSHCPTNAITGEEWCFMHSPDHQAEAQAARIRGGLNRRVSPVGEYPGSVENVTQLLAFVNRALEESWNLEGSEKRLRSIGVFLRIAVDVVGLADLDSRLQLLEGLIYDGNKATTRKAN
jgi:hypothetical protein